MKPGDTEPPFPLRSTETGLMLVPNVVKYRGAAAYSFPFTVTKKTYRQQAHPVSVHTEK